MTTPAKAIRGLPSLPILGHLLAYWQDPTGTYLRSFREHGDVSRIDFGPIVVYLFAEPDDVKHVLQDNNQNYRKGIIYEKLKLFIGNGLVNSEGDFWRRQRRLAQPAFHRQQLASFVDLMAGATAELIERWKGIAGGDQSTDVAGDMMRLTRAIVTRTLFSVEPGVDADAMNRDLTTALQITNRRIESLIDLPTTWPTPQNRRFDAAMRTLDQAVQQIIAARRRTPPPDPAGPGPERDLLSMLMAARDEETGEKMSDRQLRDEVMTIFVAGHETTANLMSWSLYLLSQHPQQARRLRDEVREVLGGRPPRMDDLPNLVYTRMVLDEAMRLYPPAWAVSRESLQPDQIGGYQMPAGSQVSLSAFVTHRHPKFWEDPERFDPERFTPERSAERPRYAYFPFGGGPRQCIGNNFALMEGQVILAMLIQAFCVDLVPGHPIALDAGVTLRPKHGIRMTVREAM
jgi:cytochrome P450